ncbi:MAG: GlxA family transcriptional regulator [Rhodobacteraceae bacterium]|nr:GlxA family transcriptional regulator [Paracoccaceae bacterium]
MKPANSAFQPDPSPLHIAVLLLPDSNALSLAATIDPLRAANRLAGRDLFSWQVFGIEGAKSTLTSGLSLETAPLRINATADMLAVIAGFHIKTHSTPALRQLLRGLAGRISTIAGIDGGGEILARAGLLSRHRATTHWEDLEDLAVSFPDINVVRDRFVLSGKYVTTGGASPCIDMMLHLISTRHGRALAEGVARAFIYDPVHTGSDPQSLVSVSRLERRAPKVAKAIRQMEDSIEDPLSVTEIARSVGLSVRRLEMLFASEFGTSPGRYFRQLRLQEAKRMVLDTRRPLQDVAVRCGFNSQAAFSRAFAEFFGSPPGALRRGRSQ